MSQNSHFIRIRHWDNLYENSRSRRIEKLTWVPIPNKHDGEGYGRIMNEKDGIEIFACWILLLQVGSKCKPRGSLIRKDGTPLDALAIVIKTGLSKNKVKLVERSISLILQIGWLERVKCKSNTQMTLDGHLSAPEGNGIEGKRSTEAKASDSSEPKKLSQSKRIKWSEESEWIDILDEDYQKWEKAYPACGIERELNAMHVWLIANPKKAKKSNYARFITTWLSRSQDRGGDARSNQGSQRKHTNYIKADKHPDTDYSKAYANKK